MISVQGISFMEHVQLFREDKPILSTLQFINILKGILPRTRLIASPVEAKIHL